MAISSAVDASAVARVVGIKTTFKNLRGGNVTYLPQRIALIGQGATAATYPLTKYQVTSAYEAGTRYGFGSPIHLAVQQLLPSNGDGVGTIPVTVYPLDDAGSGVAATGTITPAGTQTEAAAYRVVVNGIQSAEFVISAGDSVAVRVAAITAAINAVLDMPIVAANGTTVVNVSSKWKGTSANDIFIEVTGSTTAGTTFGIAQPSGGLVNPDVQDALDLVGNVWETMVLNCLDIADSAALDDYNTWAEGRWGALVRKPLVVFTGTTETSVATAIAVPEARKTQRNLAQLVAPGSVNLPLVVAARQLARIATTANNNPARDYGSQEATGLLAGGDGDQWTYAQRDQAVKGGSSTVEVKDGVVNVSDVVTFYHPDGDPLPAYRYVCDIVKIQNILFNLDIRFATTEWDGAPLIPDDQPTINPDARQPKAAVAEACALWDGLALEAIISDPTSWKANTFAAINDSNPKRLDLAATGPISGNVNILSIDLNWGFFFGSSPVVA